MALGGVAKGEEKMRTIIISIAAAGLLQGCMTEGEQTELASPGPGQVRCVDARQITARRITGPSSLEFDVGGVIYRNDLPAACPGLENRMALDSLAVEVTGAQVCAGDSFRAFDPIQARAVGVTAFPRCRLGNFTRVEPSR
jgi:hypothetical protein